MLHLSEQIMTDQVHNKSSFLVHLNPFCISQQNKVQLNVPFFAQCIKMEGNLK